MSDSTRPCPFCGGKGQVGQLAINYYCDECIDGRYEYIGGYVNACASKPTRFPHKCSGCGSPMLLPRRYPYYISQDES